MKDFVVFAIVTLVAVSAFDGFVLVKDKIKAELNPQDYQYSDTGVLPLHDTNECVSTSSFLNERIKVEYRDIEGAYGTWNNRDNIITLNPDGGFDTDTISHEVFHFVEDVMEEYEIRDPHFGAYLQGRWTACVIAIVGEDHIVVWNDIYGLKFQYYEDWNEPFKFAN